MQWREREQEAKLVHFALQAGVHKIAQDRYTYFVCQHDGYSQSHNNKTSRRNLKGRIKCGLRCPSRLLVKENCVTKSVSVRYIASHSRPLIFENTKHHPISLATRTIVKQKLSFGVLAKQILDSL